MERLDVGQLSSPVGVVDGIEDRHAGDVAGLGRGLESEELGIEAAELAHGRQANGRRRRRTGVQMRTGATGWRSGRRSRGRPRIVPRSSRTMLPVVVMALLSAAASVALAASHARAHRQPPRARGRVRRQAARRPAALRQPRRATLQSPRRATRCASPSDGPVHACVRHAPRDRSAGCALRARAGARSRSSCFPPPGPRALGVGRTCIRAGLRDLTGGSPCRRKREFKVVALGQASWRRPRVAVAAAPVVAAPAARPSAPARRPAPPPRRRPGVTAPPPYLLRRRRRRRWWPSDDERHDRRGQRGRVLHGPRQRHRRRERAAARHGPRHDRYDRRRRHAPIHDGTITYDPQRPVRRGPRADRARHRHLHATRRRRRRTAAPATRPSSSPITGDRRRARASAASTSAPLAYDTGSDAPAATHELARARRTSTARTLVGRDGARRRLATRPAAAASRFTARRRRRRTSWNGDDRHPDPRAARQAHGRAVRGGAPQPSTFRAACDQTPAGSRRIDFAVTAGGACQRRRVARHRPSTHVDHAPTPAADSVTAAPPATPRSRSAPRRADSHTTFSGDVLANDSDADNPHASLACDGDLADGQRRQGHDERRRHVHLRPAGQRALGRRQLPVHRSTTTTPAARRPRPGPSPIHDRRPDDLVRRPPPRRPAATAAPTRRCASLAPLSTGRRRGWAKDGRRRPHLRVRQRLELHDPDRARVRPGARSASRRARPPARRCSCPRRAPIRLDQRRPACFCRHARRRRRRRNASTCAPPARPAVYRHAASRLRRSARRRRSSGPGGGVALDGGAGAVTIASPIAATAGHSVSVQQPHRRHRRASPDAVSPTAAPGIEAAQQHRCGRQPSARRSRLNTAIQRRVLGHRRRHRHGDRAGTQR